MSTLSPLHDEPLDPAAAIELQDDLITACNDLDRLQRLLCGACIDLSAGFHAASDLIAQWRDGDADPRLVLAQVDEQLARTITALQFEDLATQLITHTRSRLRHGADNLAVEAMGDEDEDEDGAAFVQQAPRRPNPVTQDEMDAGSVELF
jgi:hypothetical protein